MISGKMGDWAVLPACSILSTEEVNKCEEDWARLSTGKVDDLCEEM